jgi:general secretion pathway protein M
MKALLQSRWHALSPRDQRVLSLFAGLLGLLAFVALAITPAWHTWRDHDQRRNQVTQQQAHMLALQAQALALQNRRVLSRDEALRLLQSITPAARLPLQVQGNRVSVQLKAVPAAELAQWLAQARQQAQALPVEAHLTRNPTAQAAVLWDGNLVLSLPSRSAP